MACGCFERAFDHAFERTRLGEADVDVKDFALPKDHQCGDRADTHLFGYTGIGFGIDFHEADLVLVFLGDGFKDRSHRFTRATPRGPEVYDHGYIGLDDLFLKVCGVADLDDGACLGFGLFFGGAVAFKTLGEVACHDVLLGWGCVCSAG